MNSKIHNILIWIEVHLLGYYEKSFDNERYISVSNPARPPCLKQQYFFSTIYAILVVLFSRRRRRAAIVGLRPDLAWVTSHLPINLALSEVIIRNVLRAVSAGGNTHGWPSGSRCGGHATVL